MTNTIKSIPCDESHQTCQCIINTMWYMHPEIHTNACSESLSQAVQGCDMHVGLDEMLSPYPLMGVEVRNNSSITTPQPRQR